MDETDNGTHSEPSDDEKVEFASTTGVDMFAEIAGEFMVSIFGLEPGDYIITDESSLTDFVGMDQMELPDMQKKVREMYSIDVSDLRFGNLVQIFTRIHHSKFGTP